MQVDSTSIRVHLHGTGAEKKNGEQGVGRSRGGNTSKLHLVADGAGNVLGWEVRAGQAGDAPQAADLLAPWLAPAQEVLGDAAYDSDVLRAIITEAGTIAVIKPNPTRKHEPHVDPLAYQKRHYSEQAFSKIKQFRRLATRYDKLDYTFDSFICLRIITLYLN
ncbi:MAG: IS5 family transposase [Janthinobacterium lividum]